MRQCAKCIKGCIVWIHLQAARAWLGFAPGPLDRWSGLVSTECPTRACGWEGFNGGIQCGHAFMCAPIASRRLESARSRPWGHLADSPGGGGGAILRTPSNLRDRREISAPTWLTYIIQSATFKHETCPFFFSPCCCDSNRVGVVMNNCRPFFQALLSPKIKMENK